MFIPDPDFYPSRSRIPDPGYKKNINKREGRKKTVVIPFLVATNFKKFKTYSGSRIPNPGVKKAPNPGSGSATLVKIVEIDVNRSGNRSS